MFRYALRASSGTSLPPVAQAICTEWASFSGLRPCCSQYALEAITKYGALKGGYLAVRRVLRCHPFYKGDLYDPVP